MGSTEPIYTLSGQHIGVFRGVLKRHEPRYTKNVSKGTYKMKSGQIIEQNSKVSRDTNM